MYIMMYYLAFILTFLRDYDHWLLDLDAYTQKQTNFKLREWKTKKPTFLLILIV